MINEIKPYQSQNTLKGRIAEIFFEKYCDKHSFKWIKSNQNTHFKTGSYPYPLSKFLNLVKKPGGTYSGFPDYYIYKEDIEEGLFVEVKCNTSRLTTQDKKLFSELAKYHPVVIMNILIDFNAPNEDILNAQFKSHMISS